MSSWNARANEIFADALGIVDADERSRFVITECGDDDALRQQVDALLSANRRANDFMDLPATDAYARLRRPSRFAIGDVIDKYRLLQEIGEGGFGIVYMADQKEPVRRKVALKIIKPGMDSREVIARFEAERQALAMMDHPNIATVLDAGTTDAGQPYFVMELVKGVPITQFCDENKLTNRQRLDLFICVCNAVQHAHQKGIIHRDLKPSNIMVTLNDGEPMAKVIDFGVARAINRDLTDKTLFTFYGQMVGTPQYMSPEQASISATDLDTRSDIYSLGVLLYELITGSPPLDAERLRQSAFAEIQRIIREEEPPKPSTRLSSLGTRLRTIADSRSVDAAKLQKDVAGDLDWIVMKCLEKDRVRRYETASGLVADLKRHLNDDPVLACPPSVAYRLRKVWRKHWMAVSMTAVIALVLLTATCVSLWQADKARAAEKNADEARIQAERDRDAAEQSRIAAVAAQEQLAANAYASQMQAGQAAFELGFVSKIRKVLNETASHRDRGLEWYYWHKVLRQELITLTTNEGTVECIAISPTHHHVATSGMDGSARVWETLTGTLLLDLKGHTDMVYTIGYSPDGTLIATACRDTTVRIWDAETGKNINTLRHLDRARSVAFTPDGRHLLTSGDDHLVHVWEVGPIRVGMSVQPIRTLRGHTDRIDCVVVSPDGKTVITSGTGRDQSRMWDFETGDMLRVLEGNPSIRSLAFSPSGDLLASGSWDGVVILWDPLTGEALRYLRGHQRLGTVTFSPDGSALASAGHGGIRIWNPVDGALLKSMGGHKNFGWSVAFNGDGSRLFTGGFDGEVKVWDMDDKTRTLLAGIPPSAGDQLRDWESRTLSKVELSPNGKYWAFARDETIALIDADSGEVVRRLKGHSGEVIWDLAFSANGERLISGCSDRTARVWDVSSGSQIRSFEHPDVVHSVAIASDGSSIATAGYNNQIRIHDVNETMARKSWPVHIVPRSLQFSPNGKWIVATQDGQQQVTVWDAETADEVHRIDHTSQPNFSPDSSRLVCSYERAWSRIEGKIWRTSDWREIVTLDDHFARARSLSFSPDGKRILGFAGFESIGMWDARFGYQVLKLKIDSRQLLDSRLWMVPGLNQIRCLYQDLRLVEWEGATPEQVAQWSASEAADNRRQGDHPMDVRRQKLGGFVPRWLVLAPFPCELEDEGKSYAQRTAMHQQALRNEYVPSEARLTPESARSSENESLQWRLVESTDGKLDFNALLGKTFENCVGYAVAKIILAEAKQDVLFHVKHDDGARLYVNGELVSEALGVGADPVSGINLNAGENTIVFKVMNLHSTWLASLRFSTTEGKPLDGLTFATIHQPSN